MTRIPCAVWLLAVALTACTPTAAPPESVSTPKTTHTAVATSAPWPLPAITAPAAQPDLVRAPDGSLLLSWIEHGGTDAERRHALKFARYSKGAWSQPREIAHGGDWFVNWADTPHIAMTADGALWAHWLRKSANAKYAYDVVLARSGDGGATWSRPAPVNTDGTPTEHGFVSMWPVGVDRLGIAWLDGRNTGGGEHSAHGGHAVAGANGEPGAMTLRTAVLDAALARHDERELDDLRLLPDRRCAHRGRPAAGVSRAHAG